MFRSTLIQKRRHWSNSLLLFAASFGNVVISIRFIRILKTFITQLGIHSEGQNPQIPVTWLRVLNLPVRLEQQICMGRNLPRYSNYEKL